MFEKALAFSYLRAAQSLKQFRSDEKVPHRFDEFFRVIRQIAESKPELAREFYRELIGKIRAAEYWKEDSVVIKYLMPIGDYLDTLPAGSIRHYIADAWGSIFHNTDTKES